MFKADFNVETTLELALLSVFDHSVDLIELAHILVIEGLFLLNAYVFFEKLKQVRFISLFLHEHEKRAVF